MRAVVIAVGDNPEIHPLDETRSALLFPLADRPFLQHVVECLVDRGVEEFDFVLSRDPEQLEELLGDGKRWGSRFRHHLARDPRRPYDCLRGTKLGEGPVLLARGDCLVDLPARLDDLDAPSCWRLPGEDGAPGPWCGWALTRGAFWTALPAGLDEAALLARLEAGGTVTALDVDPERFLSVRTFADILAAGRRLLDGSSPGPAIPGREAEPGVWIRRNVSLHPTVQIAPPVYIGENCRIGPAAKIGPHAVIGQDCILDGRCSVEDAQVFPGSYVGEGLELHEVLVDRNRLVNVRVGAAVEVADNFILGGIERRGRKSRPCGWLTRPAALLLLLLAWPVLLAASLFARRRVRETVRQPAPATPRQWRTHRLPALCDCTESDPGRAPCRGLGHAVRHLLPALPALLAGRVSFTGVPPRTPAELEALPADWRALALRARSGLITEALVHHEDPRDPDQAYSADAYYVAAGSRGHDARLVLAYLGGLFRSGRARKGRGEMELP